MDVALVINRMDPSRGGGQESTFALARWLLSRDIRVHVVASRFSPQVLQSGVIPHQVFCSRSRMSFGQAAEEKLRQLRPDVIHDMGYGWHCDVFQPRSGTYEGCLLRRLPLKPWWIRPIRRHLSAILPNHRRFSQLAARQYSAGKRFYVALSKMVADDFSQLHDVPADQIRLIYNGIDLQQFNLDRRDECRPQIRQRLGMGPEEVVLFIVAHNFLLKGVPALIRAAGRLVREGLPVRVLVAGRARLGPYLRMARKHGLRSKATFLGVVDDPVPYYLASDVYVHPTYYDACSRGVLEALACGLPVVTSRNNGAADLITPDAGFVVDDPGDDKYLALVMKTLLTDPQSRQRMGKAAHKLAQSYSLDRCGENFLALYDEVLGSAKRAA